jgi:hypothetical protein
MVESRYLVISYGILELTHCLVYDMSLKRWGKLKAKHVAAFNYVNAVNDTAYAKHSLALLTKAGEINTVDFDADCEKPDSVLFIGNVQFVRGNTGSLLALEASTLNSSNSLVSVLPSLNGKSWLPEIYPLAVDDDGKQVRYQENIPGRAFVLKFVGNFQLSSVTVTGLVNRGVN